MNPDHLHDAARGAEAHRGASGRASLGPTWRLYAEYWRMVRRHVPERRERLRCYVCLLGSLAVNRNGLRLLQEPVAGVDPLLRAPANEIGRRLPAATRAAHVGQLRLRQP